MPSNYETHPHRSENNNEALDQAGREQTERLKAHYEQIGEKSPERETSHEDAKHDALEAAVSHEKPTSHEHQDVSPAVRRGGSLKAERSASYHRTMTHIQSEMSAPSRAFSKVIHNKAVEKTSELAETTIARPNAILAGAICAFVFTLATYLIAKYYGYRLSGFESIGSFMAGWVIGILIDYFRVMITGKRSF